MTGNDECDRICRTRASDGTYCARFTEGFCHIAVRNCLPVRNRTQVFPNLALKSRRFDIERQVETGLILLEMIENLLHRFAQGRIVTLELRVWKFPTQIFFKLRIAVSHSHRANTSLSHGHEQAAHRR